MKTKIKHTIMNKDKLLDGILHAAKKASTPCLYKGHFTLENPELWDDTHGGGPELFIGSYAEDHGNWFATMRGDKWWETNKANFPGWEYLGMNPLSSPFIMAAHPE